jgi:hypothetical protein
MRVFNHEHFFVEVTLFIRCWIKLLSENRFDEASKVLDEPEDNGRNILWTAENLREVFLDYCWHERMPDINDPFQMDLNSEVIEFYQYDDGSGYAVDYDIPLDGEWGDLTAKFSFKKMTKSLYITILYDMRVM